MLKSLIFFKFAINSIHKKFILNCFLFASWSKYLEMFTRLKLPANNIIGSNLIKINVIEVILILKISYTICAY